MDFSYLNKSFSDYSKELTELAKTYFPNTYSDFSDESVGKMFFDLVAMVGDTLSFYSDSQLSENLLLQAKERKNLFSISYQLGYKPKVTSPSVVTLTVYQQIPSKLVEDAYFPDYDYCVLIESGTVVTSLTTGINFLIQDTVDFTINNINDKRTERVWQTDNLGNPTYYLLSKEVLAISGQTKSQTFDIGTAQKYLTLDLIDDNIIEILNIVDSDGYKWFEVDNLAQDTIFEDFKDSNGLYHLKVKRVPRRFVSRFREDNTLQIEFGSGINDSVDEEVILNPDNVGINIYNTRTKLETSYDITNFTTTNTYGIAPRNVTLTVNYLVGGGVESNVEANTINSVSTINVVQNTTLDQNQLEYVLQSISTNNVNPARGGSDGDSIEEIRLKALSAYTTQNRVVSESDYLVRCLSLPSKYGTISKVYVQKAKTNVNLYVLGYGNDGTLSTLNQVGKENLKTYLSRYSGDDKIVIQDANIINFKLYYDISILPTYNSNEILIKCNNILKDFFDRDKWSINQPIILTDIYNALSQVKGLQSVIKITLENVYGNGYSQWSYDFTGATRNNIIYPPIDLSIFEIKSPMYDIKGRVNNY